MGGLLMNAPRTPLINTRQGIALVGNDRSLYLLFLRQFSQDDTLRSLAAALRAGDASQAYLYAHSLKGLCAQLGLDALFEQAAALCALLRDGKPESLPAAAELFPGLQAVYDETTAAIARCDNPASL